MVLSRVCDLKLHDLCFCQQSQTWWSFCCSLCRYIHRISEPVGDNKVNLERVEEWVKKIDEWDAKPFTLTHVPERVLRFFSRFKRRVVIARMAKNPDLANKYHSKLNSMHAMEEKLKDGEALEANKEQLINMLDDAEAQLNTTEYMAGFEFTVADAALIPVLARIELLKLNDEYLEPRLRLLDYWERVKTRASYKKVIGGYSSQLKQMKLVVPSMCNVGVRNVLKRFWQENLILSDFNLPSFRGSLRFVLSC